MKSELSSSKLTHVLYFYYIMKYVGSTESIEEINCLLFDL
jgi:hypothetical protein